MSKIPSSGYDLIAPFYDDGVGLLFGKGIFDAQLCFLSEVTAGSNVLILGGGSGWLLEELFKTKKNLRVIYIDASAKMIELARKKVNLPVEFICGTEMEIPENEVFDFIITNFYVDGFSQKSLDQNVAFIKRFLKEDGKWIVSDFVQTGKTKHRRKLWLIHLFFRILIKHPNHNLVDWQKAYGLSGRGSTEDRRYKVRDIFRVSVPVPESISDRLAQEWIEALKRVTNVAIEKAKEEFGLISQPNNY